MKLPSICLTVPLAALAACAVLAPPGLPAEPLSVGALGTPLPEAEKQPQEVVDAITYFKRLDFDKSLELLREAANKYPDLPPARVVMAALFGQVNQPTAVRSSLERAIVESAGDPEAYVILGDAALREGRVCEAGLLFAEANSLLAAFQGKRKKILEPQVYAGLAAVAEGRAAMSTDDKAREEKELDTAEKHLQAWLTVETDDPKRARAMQRLARTLFKRGKAQEARDQLKKANEADPNTLYWAAQMALLYHGEDDFTNAEQFMKYALAQAKDDLRVHLVAAEWCVQTSQRPGQLEKAKEMSARAMQIDPSSLPAMILRGVVALFQKDYPSAERYFESALLQSGSFAAKNNLALALCEQDSPEKKRRALEYAVENARLYSRNPEAASTYGWVLYRSNRLTDADNVLSRLVRGGRVSEDTAYYAARVAAELNRPEEAMRLLERALGTDRPFSKRKEAQALLEQLKKG